MRWSTLPALPDEQGFAATFAGVSEGALVVAGGANIPGERWGPEFVKKWYSGIFAFSGGAWSRVGELPHPCAYGISVTFGESVVCGGGADRHRHFAECFRLAYRGPGLPVAIHPLPPFPQPCANACGALSAGVLYVAGGLAEPGSTEARHVFWALNLQDPAAGWQVLEPWPGPERMLAVAAGTDEGFYLFSGARLHAGPDGRPVREYLRDAFAYSPGRGWRRLADLPRPAVAAPSPAPSLDRTHLLVIGGDDGANVHFEPVAQHPGFPRDVLAYDTEHDRWSVAGTAPFSRATVPVAPWQGGFAIVNGEVRPRVRTPEVWWLQVP